MMNDLIVKYNRENLKYKLCIKCYFSVQIFFLLFPLESEKKFPGPEPPQKRTAPSETLVISHISSLSPILFSLRF